MSARHGSRSFGWADRLAIGAVCLAACLPYLQTIPDYFVQDDFGVVQLLAQKPWTTFPHWFTMVWMEDIWGSTPDEIRPFPALSYQITALWGAAAPEGHHAFNILLHTFNSLLVFALARDAARAGLAAATVAGIAFALLPVAPESVAWITGRVDTMPALFYLASVVAYVRWRGEMADSIRLYVWSLIWFFVALFSKQNTITMVPALIAYDLLLGPRPIRLSWRSLWPYGPFAIMTLGYLMLRYVVLGEVLRESHLSAQRFAEFEGTMVRHLRRIVFGDAAAISAITAALSAAYALTVILTVAAADTAVRSRVVRAMLYFGPVWIALGLAPAIAATYESPRHAYLAAVGWAIVLAIATETLWRAAVIRRHPFVRAWSQIAVVAAAAILISYAVRLHALVSDWSHRSAVSEAAAIHLDLEVTAITPGALVLVNAPVSSWEWAMPFVARPPYMSNNLMTHARIIAPERLHCCRGHYWEQETRGALQRWVEQPGAPILALHISANGEVRRLTDTDDPSLAAVVKVLPEIASRSGLDGAILDILRKIVAGRGHVIRPALRS